MDSEAFDRFISALGRRQSRRGVVQVVVATVGLGGLTRLGRQDTAARKRKRRCTGGTLKCAVGCIDPQTDFNNCGTCGNVCGQGQTCTAGTCTGGGGSTAATTCAELHGAARSDQLRWRQAVQRGGVYDPAHLRGRPRPLRLGPRLLRQCV